MCDKSPRPDDTFSRTDFQYGQARDLFICPGGKKLKTSGTVHDGATFKYLAKPSDCGGCPLNPSAPQGRGRRYANARALANAEAFKQSRRERKKLEMSFADLKRILKLDRLRLRGLSGARDEVLLAATAQNLRKLSKYAGRGPPHLTALCPRSLGGVKKARQARRHPPNGRIQQPQPPTATGTPDPRVLQHNPPDS